MTVDFKKISDAVLKRLCDEWEDDKLNALETVLYQISKSNDTDLVTTALEAYKERVSRLEQEISLTKNGANRPPALLGHEFFITRDL